MAVVFAVGTLTAAGVATDTQTIVVGGKTYTTQTALTNVDGNVLIGANAAATLANLKAAINLSAGAGTTYAAATTANPLVVANTLTATTLQIIARIAGAIGNLIGTTETQTNWSFGGAVLASGSGSLDTEFRTLLAEEQLNAKVTQKIIDLIDPEGDE